MPTDQPTTPLTDPDRYAVASRGDAVRLPGWMTGEDAAEPLTRGERARLTWARHRGKLLVGLVALVLLGLLVATVVVGRHVVDRVRSAPPPTPPPVPTSAVGEPRDLFAGTAAADFATGERAIVLPTAAAQGPFTAAQVRAALTQVREALVAARVDLGMLLGDPEPFLALLAPDNRRERAVDFTGNAFLHYATRVDSHDPAADDPRAKGTITYRATTNESGIPVLEITTRYVWVYPYDIPRTTPGEAGLVAIHDKVVWHVPRADAVGPTERGLWLVSAQAATSNADCLRLEEGFLAVEPWRGGRGSFEAC